VVNRWALKSALTIGWMMVVACSLDDAGSNDTSHPAQDAGGGDVTPVDGATDVPADASVSDGADADAAKADTCRPEICNGLDDDCDGVTDESCPTSVTVSGVNGTSAGFGDADEGAGFGDMCADGSAIVSIDGRTSKYIDVLRVGCQALTLVEDKSQIPYTYRIGRTGNIDYKAAHGVSLDTSPVYTLACPGNSVAVGITVEGKNVSGGGPGQDRGVYKMKLTCAELQIIGARLSYTVGYGATTEMAANGTLTGDSYPAFGGPTPRFFSGAFGRSADHVMQLGVYQRNAQLVLRQ
jgi:hypothetical protein